MSPSSLSSRSFGSRSLAVGPAGLTGNWIENQNEEVKSNEQVDG